MSDVANDSKPIENGETPEIKVKDRRRFTADGDPVEPTAEAGEAQAQPDDAPDGAEQAQTASAAEAESGARTNTDESASAAEPPSEAASASESPTETATEAPEGETARPGPLPPASFEMLILSLGMQAQMELGAGLPNPENPPNLDIARHTIDLLAVLQEKTKGNLSLAEQRLLENTLTELRFRYVQAVGDINKAAGGPSS